MRVFESGATRDNDTDKVDYDGFLSPLVVERFGRYMHEKRVQPDGNLRDSDNWQKGIPIDAYRKSIWRHWVSVWSGLRTQVDNELPNSDNGSSSTIEELMALLFNVQGLAHELIKKEQITLSKEA